MDEITGGPEKMNQIGGENPAQPGQPLTNPVPAGDVSVDQAMWSLLVQLSRKLQVSSASIKAGVSSLLDYNIFWDGSTQHEFLDSIDASTDQISRLIMLLSLVSRAQAGSLEIKAEPQMLQEIVSMAREQFQKGSTRVVLEIILPQAGKPVLVDYEYLMLALRFIFEVLSDFNLEPKTLNVFAFESEQGWKLDIVSERSIIDLFALIVNEKIVELLNANSISPENRLKLYIVGRIFLQMKILVELVEYSDHKTGLRLIVPCAAGN
jgi:hypothetical protein